MGKRTSQKKEGNHDGSRLQFGKKLSEFAEKTNFKSECCEALSPEQLLILDFPDSFGKSWSEKAKKKPQL